jgi:acetylornithine/succinyldiaminopimelate/putrescine aminotransferase
MFGYDKFIALTSGGEAVDAAVKIARKWGYISKKNPRRVPYLDCGGLLSWGYAFDCLVG